MKNPEEILMSPATAIGAITLGFTTLGLVWHLMGRDKGRGRSVSIPQSEWLAQGETPEAYKNLRVGTTYTSVLDIPQSASSIFSRYEKQIMNVNVREGGGKAYVTIVPKAAGKDAIALWQYEDEITWMRILPVKIGGAAA